MTTTQGLARLERVDDLRSIWPYEDQNFTPWLAEHIEELGDALGLEIELESTEAPVGGFSLDILAREVGRDRKVIIENQLGETNHSHLGQLLTYAAGYEAGVVVWIAKEFRDEHRAALDLLNRHTDEEMEFFGVVVELWKIGDSLPAPNFKVVSAPNEWGKQTKQTISNRGDGEVSERRERYRSFFQGLIDRLRNEPWLIQGHQTQPRNGYVFQMYGRGVHSTVSFGRPGIARVAVYIDGGDKSWNKRLFDNIAQIKEEIEAELGGLVWERLDNRRACRISAQRPGSIDDADEILNEIRAWMAQNLLAFRKTFGPRLENLIRSTPQGDFDEEERDDELDD